MRIACLVVGMFIAASCGESRSPSISAEGKAALDEVLRFSGGAGDVPGVVAVVTGRDSILYRSAFGVMDYAGEKAMRTDAIFDIASMTNPSLLSAS